MANTKTKKKHLRVYVESAGWSIHGRVWTGRGAVMDVHRRGGSRTQSRQSVQETSPEPGQMHGALLPWEPQKTRLGSRCWGRPMHCVRHAGEARQPGNVGASPRACNASIYMCTHPSLPFKRGSVRARGLATYRTNGREENRSLAGRAVKLSQDTNGDWLQAFIEGSKL